MLNKEKFESMDWKFRESDNYNCFDFKSPRMKEFAPFYNKDTFEDQELIDSEEVNFRNQVYHNIYNQLSEVKNNLYKQVDLLIRKKQMPPEKITLTIDIYT